MRKAMMFKVLAVASLLAAFTLFSGGCAKKTVQTEEAMKETTPQQQPVMEKETQPPMGAEEPLDTKPWQQQGKAQILEGRTTAPLLPVYFDFDRSNIRDDQKPRIKKNAEYLKGNAQVNIRIEGNCDERGTNEYNMALGERRAMSAKKYMMSLGVAGDRMKTISYGEEKPLNYGHDELSWSQNRRDDFVILN